MKERCRITGQALGRGSLLGIALYLSLTADPHVNLQLNLLSYTVAVIWCFMNGIADRHRWWAPFLEGLVVHVCAVVLANFLTAVAGSPFQ